MESLTDIPFELDVDALLKRMRLEPGTEYCRQFEELVSKAQKTGKPKAVYDECFVQARGDDTVTVGGITFTSRTLAKNLDGLERVFPYVATCGREVELDPPDTSDFLKVFWWDAIKGSLLQSARKFLNEHLTRRYLLGKTAGMSPGAGDVGVWPIEDQKGLFALLGDVKGAIGVELTDSCLMIPVKTVSGIRFPAEHDFRSCQVCHREKCPSRRAPFDKALWDSIRHE